MCCPLTGQVFLLEVVFPLSFLLVLRVATGDLTRFCVLHSFQTVICLDTTTACMVFEFHAIARNEEPHARYITEVRNKIHVLAGVLKRCGPEGVLEGG